MNFLFHVRAGGSKSTWCSFKSSAMFVKRIFGYVEQRSKDYAFCGYHYLDFPVKTRDDWEKMKKRSDRRCKKALSLQRQIGLKWSNLSRRLIVSLGDKSFIN